MNSRYLIVCDGIVNATNSVSVNVTNTILTNFTSTFSLNVRSTVSIDSNNKKV